MGMAFMEAILAQLVLYLGQEVFGLGLGYIGYSGVLFGFKMEPSCIELKIYAFLKGFAPF